MLGLQFLGLFLLIQFAYGNGDEDLIPREFTATPLNSTSIFVSWKEPNRSSELSGEYQINVFNITHGKQYRLRETGGTFTNLQPSTNHTFTVRAFWKNDTPVDAVAFTFGKTGPQEELLPREFTATALNSSSILVSWKEPDRSSEFSGKYQLSFYNGRRVIPYYLEDTEAQFSKLRPSRRYAFAVRAFWKNDTPVDAAVYAMAETLPQETDLESSMSPDLPEEEVHTEGNLHGSTNSPDETTLNNGEAASLFPDLQEEEVHHGSSTNAPDDTTFNNGQASSSSPNLLPEEVHTEVNSDISTNSPSEISLDNETDLESSMSPDLPEEEVHTEGNLHGSTNSPDETTLNNGEAASLFPDLQEEEVHHGSSTNAPDDTTFNNGQASSSSPNLLPEEVHTEVNSDISTNSPSEISLDNGLGSSSPSVKPREEEHANGNLSGSTNTSDAETFSSTLASLNETAETDGLDDTLSSAPSIALCAKLTSFIIIFVSLRALQYM
ncbi:hypothetical protein SprV_0602230700 [Sparganum proliferum]